MNRTLMQIRSLLFRSGVKRAEWLRKKKIFGAIGSDVMIQDYKLPFNPDKVFIGNNVRLASDVSLITHDVSYHVLNNLYKTTKFQEKTGTITIGDNVFVGSKTIILYDVKIGNNVIVGAGSVVTKDLPDGAICAGIPCKKLVNLKISATREEISNIERRSGMIPKLSIIVPVYNVEKYLSQCLDSLVNQTLKEIEIILVNDGSTDESEKICRSYAKKDGRVTVYSKPNGGLSDARNYGLRMAMSKTVGFVDSDDFIDLDMFQALLELKEKTNSEIAVGGVKMATNNGEVYMVRSVEEETVSNCHDAMEELLKSKRITNSVCNKIFDISLFEQIEFPVGKLYEDEFVTYKLFDRAHRVAMTNQVFYYYRLSPNSITHKTFSEREFDRIYASQMKVNYIQQAYPDLVKYAQRYLVYDCVMSLSKMTEYKESYSKLTRDNIRKYLKCFLLGDYSKGTKAFAVIAAVSPGYSVLIFNKIKRFKMEISNQ